MTRRAIEAGISAHGSPMPAPGSGDGPGRWAVPALLASVLAGLAGPAPAQEPTKAAAATTVPFELLPSNHMLVRAAINGGEPGRFIFDLGSPLTLLGSKAAQAGGVIDDAAPRAFLFGARGDGTIRAFRVGDVEAKDLPVMVMDHPAVTALSGLLGRPIDGLIGYTFFARYRTTIDYQAKQMTLEPVDFEARDLMKSLPDQLRAPKVAARRILAPAALWGLAVGPPEGADAPGVPVTAVRPGSPAAAAGLRAGDVLTALDGRWTTTVADTYAAAAGIEPGRAAAVVVLRGGEELTLTVTPRAGL